MDDGPSVTPEGVVSVPSRRPPNFVAAVIGDAPEFELALEDLVVAGIARESVAGPARRTREEAIAGRYESRSWLQRVGDMLTDEREHVDLYKEAARQGHFVVGVMLPERARLRGNASKPSSTSTVRIPLSPAHAGPTRVTNKS